MFKNPNKINRARITIMMVMVMILFSILVIKLYHIQILQYDRFAGIADANMIRVVPLEAPRGIIFDRNGIIIADNKSQYNVNIIPFALPSSKDTYTQLGKILDISPEKIKERVRKNWHGRFSPARVAEDIDFQVLTKIEEHRLDLPGVISSIEPLRSFPSNANLSHVIGYLREVSDRDLNRLKQHGYKQGDLIGWKGIEREYEEILKGTRGYEYLQVDALGREVGRLESRQNIESKPGNDIYLSIDLRLQEYSEKLLEDKRGVVLVMDSNNGELLACVSKPDYSPNIFSGIVEPDDWNKLRDDPERPLYNRFATGLYPPGSTYKMIATITAVEKNILDTNATFNCSGVYKLGRRQFKCWNLAGHGKMDMHSAIVNSCNVYFYNLIRRVELHDWVETGRIFGFGEKTGIDLPNESVSPIPDKQFLDNKYGKRKWTTGNLLNMVIGQGDVLVTPIQVVKYIACIGTKGKLVQPHLGLRYFDKDENKFIKFIAQTDSVTQISDKTWAFVNRALYGVVNDAHGTAKSAKTKGLDVFGKTGTAQNPHGEPHAWFAGNGKAENQMISVVVLLENTGGGGHFAAPIAGKLFQYYRKHINPIKKNESIDVKG